MHVSVRSNMAIILCALVILGRPAAAQVTATAAPTDTANDPVRILVSHLDLEKYKATISGLTQFGDRRQGTDRNRAAVDWIEAQLKSYGCSNTERIKYVYEPPPVRAAGAPGAPGAAPTGPRPQSNVAQ